VDVVMPCGLVTLLTDFGTADPFAGIMKGVMLGIHPTLRVVDLTHAVPAQQVLAGALLLRSAVSFFPPGTIHVAVVDPGVGSSRAPIVIETEHALLIGPDNGLLSPAAALLRPRSRRRLENVDLFRHPVSRTFHGRDIFAPVAAHLARGVALTEVGPVIGSHTELQIPRARRTGTRLIGEVLHVDGFGNLVTNLDAEELSTFSARPVSVSILGTRVAGPVTAYATVPEGIPLSIIGSWDLLEIAVRNGSAAARFGAGPGTQVTVEELQD
jgi:S-adenosylmethionine hydrolase